MRNIILKFSGFELMIFDEGSDFTFDRLKKFILNNCLFDFEGSLSIPSDCEIKLLIDFIDYTNEVINTDKHSFINYSLLEDYLEYYGYDCEVL